MKGNRKRNRDVPSDQSLDAIWAGNGIPDEGKIDWNDPNHNKEEKAEVILRLIREYGRRAWRSSNDSRFDDFVQDLVVYVWQNYDPAKCDLQRFVRWLVDRRVCNELRVHYDPEHRNHLSLSEHMALEDSDQFFERDSIDERDTMAIFDGAQELKARLAMYPRGQIMADYFEGSLTARQAAESLQMTVDAFYKCVERLKKRLKERLPPSIKALEQIYLDWRERKDESQAGKRQYQSAASRRGPRQEREE